LQASTVQTDMSSNTKDVYIATGQLDVTVAM